MAHLNKAILKNIKSTGGKFTFFSHTFSQLYVEDPGKDVFLNVVETDLTAVL